MTKQQVSILLNNSVGIKPYKLTTYRYIRMSGKHSSFDTVIIAHKWNWFPTTDILYEQFFLIGTLEANSWDAMI